MGLCGKLAFAKYEKIGGSNRRIINFGKGNGVGNLFDQFLLTLILDRCININIL